MLQARPPQYITSEFPVITLIDPFHKDFSKVLTPLDSLEENEENTLVLSKFKEKAGIVGNAPTLRKELEKAFKVALYDDTVLILGESGTGKELMARFIHLAGCRKGEFVAVNCGSVPKTLVENELFGYKKGAFTGTDKDRQGAFVKAQGGTLFLDEIGEMPPALQVKLLRVLQEKKIRPVGADQEIPVNIRVLAATSVDIKEAI